MPGPLLTDAEKAQLQKEASRAQGAADTITAQIVAQNARAAELAVADGALKKFFDYYNGIISKYDDERKAINGQYIASPITETDILNCANLTGGRTSPLPPSTDLVRIPQFDGGPLITNATHEGQAILAQAAAEDKLVNGYGAATYAGTILTNSILNASSTTLQLKDVGTTFSISPGTIFVVDSGTDVALVRCDTFVMQTTPAPPPFIADLNITVLVPPTAPIATGQTLKAFTGFTNTERNTKTPTLARFQAIMTYLVNDLKSKINSRITFLDSQTTALSANQDPDGVSEISTTLSNVAACKTFLNSYLVTTDVSDTGLASLATNRSSRTSQNTARITQITNAYTGRTENYFNRRYSTANDRANVSRGTLRMQKIAEQVAATSTSYGSTLNAQAAALKALLS